MLRASDAGVVRAIVTNITGPAFVFYSIHGKPINRDMMIAPLVHFAALLVVVVAAFLIAQPVVIVEPRAIRGVHPVGPRRSRRRRR